MRRLCSIRAGNQRLEQFVLSADGGLIAAVCDRDSGPPVRVWAVDGAVEKLPVEPSRAAISELAFSPTAESSRSLTGPGVFGFGTCRAAGNVRCASIVGPGMGI